jgi:exodeoxyribonuclease VII large subunit
VVTVSREVRHDGAGAFQVRFAFDRGLVDLIKTLPNRRWNAAERFWWVPEQDVVLLVELLEPRNFRFDAATRRAYQAFGGTLPLADAEPEDASTPRLPGLFDDDGLGPAGDMRGAKAEDYTVSGLNERVRQIIAEAFPQPVWLVGEISGFNRNAHKRHVSFQLDEKEDGGKTVSSVNATLFDRTRREVERTLAAAGDPFRLEDEITVRVRVRVDLYVPWGSYRVVVEELDVNYTLGEAARRREEIIRKLTEEGLVGLNTALSMPPLPLRVGLVTSLGSDAYNDVLRTLQESQYAFRVLAHGARVQGHATEPSVLNALDTLRDRAGELDVVLICRGGGSRTDLAWFDSEALGRAVARFPLPVVVGIGHEQDRSVLDEVGWRCKTPTAAAAFLVETVRQSLEAVETLGANALALAARRLEEERQRGADRARRLSLAARALLQRELVELGHRRARTSRGARALLASAAERVARLVRDLPKAGAVHLARQRTFLDHVRRAVTQAARRDLAAVSGKLEDLVRALAPTARRRLAHETERTVVRGRRLDLVDPRRVLDRGYAILRTGDGRVLTTAALAPAGTPLTARLKRGGLKLRSEGTTANQGGEGNDDEGS